MPVERKIRLLVADNQEMVRCGAKALLAGTEIKVVAEASTGQAAVKLALEKEVDLLLLDVRMPDGDGLNVSCDIVKQHVKHILRKIGVRDRTQAALWAVTNGLV